MKYNKLSVGLALLFAVHTSAQTSFDAARLYGQELIGTARYVGMGGAMGALGSDASVISQNPAGIGTYRQSDFNATFAMSGARTVTSPLLTVSGQGREGMYSFYSSNRKSPLACSADMLSVILSGCEGSSTYANFGFVFRRLSHINSDLNYIDSYYDHNGYEILREFRDHSNVIVNAYDFNLSSNFEDIVYLGATMELLSTNVDATGYIYDYYADGEDRDRLYSENRWEGAHGPGFNMSLGVIVRPVPVLRIGASLKIPTFFSTAMDYEDNMYIFNEPDINGDFYASGIDYRFSSPWSSSLSAGLTLGTTAFDVELEKHYTGRATVSTYDRVSLDAQGACQYKDYTTFRMGAETNISKFSLRCGLCHNGSMFADNARPYLKDTDFNDSRADFQLIRPTTSNYLAFGLGYCSAPDAFNSQFYVDMALVHGVQNIEVCANEASLSNEVLTSVYTQSEPVVDYKYKSNRFVLTLGWCF